jgi:acyl carrier protein
MRDEIKKLMANIFSVDINSIEDNIAYGSHEKWDSIHHLNLIVELESTYNVLFEPEDIQKMTDIDRIIDCIVIKKQI